jgi:predicted phosphodiesterase
MDRRAFLKKSGQFALALSLLPRKARGQNAADAQNIELVTVTDTSAVLTWESGNPTEAAVLYGSSPGNLDQQATDPAGLTRYHRVEIPDLDPGTTVHYQVQADGVAAENSEYSPGRFDTLAPPPGSLLYSFATINDLHVGLTSAGAVGGLDSFVPVECPLVDKHCWEVANRPVVEAINRTDAAFTVVKGDISHEYRQEEFEAARDILDGLKNPYYAVRGNHDRQGEQPEDYFSRVFGLEKTHYSFAHKGVRFVILDSSNLETGFPEIGEEQFDWLDTELRSLGDEKCLLVLHHAVTEEASIFFSLFTEDQERLFSRLSRNSNLAGILSGHSHRTLVTHQPEIGDVPCIETACTVHYPGGYCLYRVYTGGFMQTYHKIDSEDWRIWEEAGRAMYHNDAQNILLGPLDHRNFVHRFETPIPETEPSGCDCGVKTEGGGLAVVAGALVARKLTK